MRIKLNEQMKKIFYRFRESYIYLRLRGTKKVVLDGVDMVFSLKDPQSRVFFYHPFFRGEHYEQAVTHHLIDRLKASRCFVDVGANIGFYTVLAGKLLERRGGIVHAIEMDLDNIQRTRANVRLNRLHNVSVHHVALGDRIGTVDYYRRESFRHTLGVSQNEWDHFQKISVPMKTLDSLAEEFGFQPDIVKIDVEGAEFLVLQGMQKILAQSKLEVYCEVHIEEEQGGLGSFGHTFEDVWEMFSDHHFSMYEIPLRQENSALQAHILKQADEVTRSTMIYAIKNT